MSAPRNFRHLQYIGWGFGWGSCDGHFFSFWNKYGKNKKNSSPFPVKDHDSVSDTVLQGCSYSCFTVCCFLIITQNMWNNCFGSLHRRSCNYCMFHISVVTWLSRVLSNWVHFHQVLTVSIKLLNVSCTSVYFTWTLRCSLSFDCSKI